MNAKSKTLLVSHDAGGAYELAAWAKHSLAADDFDVLLAGPAVKIFEQAFSLLSSISLEDVLIPHYRQVITSTSGAEDWERRQIAQARQQQIPVISVLDHWVHYRERFLLGQQPVYPDKIWVVDPYAYEIAKGLDGFPLVEQIENHHLNDMVAEIHALTSQWSSSSTGTRVLYVSEPAESYGYNDLDALEDFIKFLRQRPISSKEGYCLRLRLHPKEPQGKYDTLVARYADCVPIEISHGTSLAEDCAWSEWVVGCQTKAMVVALAAGKRVSSCLPATAPPLVLPHSGIERLFTQ